jgi:hypothetical protein
MGENGNEVFEETEEVMTMKEERWRTAKRVGERVGWMDGWGRGPTWHYLEQHVLLGGAFGSGLDLGRFWQLNTGRRHR